MITKTTFKLFLIFFFCLPYVSVCQNILISQGGTVSVAGSEILYDAGGPTNNDTNLDYIITLVPAIAGQKVYLDFSEFNTYFDQNIPAGDPNALVANADYLDIFDGTTVTSTQLCQLAGDFSTFPNSNSTSSMGVKSDAPFAAFTNPGIFAATNSAGALTIRFKNYTGSTATRAGFKAFIRTYTALGLPGCSISLTGTSSCIGQPITLTAVGDVVSAPINNDFNNGQLGANWVSNFTATFTNPVCAATGRDGITNNSTFLWVANVNRPRSLASVNGFNLVNGGTVTFDYRQARENGPIPCDGPDRDQYDNLEGIYMQYSIDGGSTWTTFNYIYPREDNNGTNDFYQGTGEFVQSWRKIIVPIPNAAKTTNTKFRWHQEKATSNTTDNWGLDNIVITTPLNKTITITNLATSAVIASSSISPLNATVNPVITTTYRATVSDGTSSCYDDFTITPVLSPTINCLASTLSSVAFNWVAVPGATSYTVSYQIGTGTIVTIGDIGNTLTYTASSTVANPILPGDNITITVTPIGGLGTCFILATNTCTTTACTTPATPTINTTAPTCTANGTSAITNYDSTNSYTFSPSGPTVGALGAISGAIIGTSYTITATKNTCTSVVSLAFTNASQLTTPATPTITTAAPTCTANGTSTINNYDSTNSYTFTPSGPTVGALGLISGAIIGTSYTITATKNTCTSAVSVAFTNASQLTTPSPNLIDGTICVNQTSGIPIQSYILDTQLNNPNYVYNWFILNTITTTYDLIMGANSATYETFVAGNYKVEIVNTLSGCSTFATANVIAINPATVITADVSDAFTDNIIITVTIYPTGTFQYALDGGLWQDSNVFSGVSAGEHIILVRDNQGCTYLQATVFVFDYPKFFTPNGDGMNDTWNIIGLKPIHKPFLYIFDRFGKLIKQINPLQNDKGWDGTYNNADLPSTDYWFTLDYIENYSKKTFKSHFSLKR